VIEAGKTGGPWTDQENDLIVADYFSMLNFDLAGRPFSKTDHRGALSERLPARNDKSIEFKHMNISAVMLGLGQPRVSGYPPAPNFQLSLIDAVLRWLAHRPEWGEPLKASSSGAALRDESPLWISTPPTLANEPSPVDPKFLAAITSRVDVAAMDAKNKNLGRAGEERAFHHERASLSVAGRSDLARRVRWTAAEDGDGYGYDIHSFEPDGRDRLIEVKTTNGWDRTPFHISTNELNVADERRDVWCLLRLYDFARAVRAFEIRPPLERHVELTPTTFRASFQSSAGSENS
jgi:hypothetical protein